MPNCPAFHPIATGGAIGHPLKTKQQQNVTQTFSSLLSFSISIVAVDLVEIFLLTVFNKLNNATLLLIIIVETVYSF